MVPIDLCGDLITDSKCWRIFGQHMYRCFWAITLNRIGDCAFGAIWADENPFVARLTAALSIENRAV